MRNPLNDAASRFMICLMSRCGCIRYFTYVDVQYMIEDELEFVNFLRNPNLRWR